MPSFSPIFMVNNDFSLHWAFSSVKKTIAQHGEKTNYTCASGITPSGTIHIGNFRELITVDLVNRAFHRFGKNSRHIHSWDDNDVFRKVPENMPNKDMLNAQLRKCIVDIPDPFGELDSYASRHIKDFEDGYTRVGIFPACIRQSKKYRHCEYAEQIKEALDHLEVIKEALNEHREEPLADEWLPVTMFCETCFKDTVKLKYLPPYELSYECDCGHKDVFDFRKKGLAKLLWRVDWPMRWAYEDVNFEPGGKDHSTPGSSYDTGKSIIENVWKGKAPSYQMYDFIRIKGAGGKISSSTGNVITLTTTLEIYEPEIVRFLFAGTRPNSEFAISFDADVLKIYEDYDNCERIYYGLKETNEKEKNKQSWIYEFSQLDENVENLPKECPIQIGFRHITTILQIKDLDENKTYDFFKEFVKTPRDETKLKTRINCVKNWLNKYADEQFKFRPKKEKDMVYFNSLNDLEKQSLDKLKNLLSEEIPFPEFEKKLFEIPKETGLEMNDFFKISYMSIIGKEKGPKLAIFIEELGKKRVADLL